MGHTKNLKGKPLTDQEVRALQTGDQFCMESTTPSGNTDTFHLQVADNKEGKLFLAFCHEDDAIDITVPDLSVGRSGNKRAFFHTEATQVFSADTVKGVLDLIENALSIAEHEDLLDVDSFYACQTETEDCPLVMLLRVNEHGQSRDFVIKVEEVA
jgi:hypothetical protein